MAGYLDRAGAHVAVGDSVEVMEIPPELLRGLPAEDQSAIKKKLGSQTQIVGFDGAGNAELEFAEPDNDFRTIWISPRCLIKR